LSAPLLAENPKIGIVTNVGASWLKGFVDDVNFSTASRSVLENVRRL
jgi:UDP-N-acetylmuramyl pentapeptide synthase